MELGTYTTVSEAARRLCLDPQTIYKWCRIGRLRPVRIGRRLRLPLSELEKLLNIGKPYERDGDDPV